MIFSKPPTAVAAWNDPIRHDAKVTQQLDWETELAVVIGKTGKFFGPDEAANDYVAGFTVFNDITARDIQRREMRSGVFAICKGIDTFCPLGPWIVTPDEIADMAQDDGHIRVTCEFCNRHYDFEAREFIQDAASP